MSYLTKEVEKLLLSLCAGRQRMHYWFYMLDGLSVYSALLILTFIANMFPLIGSFVKERREPVPLWQWLIIIISCLSILDKPTLTQHHGCLYALAHFTCTSPFTSVSYETCLLWYSLRTLSMLILLARIIFFLYFANQLPFDKPSNLFFNKIFGLQCLLVPLLWYLTTVKLCKYWKHPQWTESTYVSNHPILKPPRDNNPLYMGTFVLLCWHYSTPEAHNLNGDHGQYKLSVILSKYYL